LVQAKGFKKEDFEGEGCQLDPCIIDDEESRAEGKMIVDNLNAQEGSEMNNFRFALCRIHARRLGMLLRGTSFLVVSICALRSTLSYPEKSAQDSSQRSNDFIRINNF